MDKDFTDVTKKSNKLKFIIIGVLLVVAIGIGLFVGYKKLYSSPEKVYERAINNVYKYLSDTLNDFEKESLDIDVLNDPVVYDFDLSVKSNMEELKVLEGLKLKANIGMDYKNKNMLLSADLSKDNEHLVNADLLYNNNMIYLNSKDLLDNPIKLDEVDFSNVINLDDLKDININTKDTDKVLKELKDILIKSLDSGKFKSEKTTIKIDNKDVKVNKIDYLMDEENAKRTYEFLCDELVKNDVVLDYLAKFTNSTKEELKENITSSKNDVKYDDFKNVYFTLYTKGLNEIVGGSLNDGKETLISFTNNGKLMLDINLDTIIIKVNENDKEYEITINENNVEVANIKLYKEDNLKMEFSIKAEGEEYSGSVLLNSKKDSKTKMTGDFEVKFNGKVNGEDINLEVSGTFNVEGKTFEVFDTTNSKSTNELTEEESMKLSTKLMEILGKLDIQM